MREAWCVFATVALATLVDCRNRSTTGASSAGADASGKSAVPSSSEGRDVGEVPNTKSSPQSIGASHRVTPPARRRLSAGSWHNCLIDRASKLWCWGGNAYGAIGNGKHGWRGRSEDEVVEDGVARVPVQVNLSGLVTFVSSGGLATCAIDAAQELWCWGANENLDSLDGIADLPRRRDLGGRVLSVEVGEGSSCAVRVDNSLWCWGHNNRGQLGWGKPGTDSFQRGTRWGRPGQVRSLGNSVQSVTLPNSTACAIKLDHSVWCWGENDYQELGKESPRMQPIPVMVVPSDFEAVEIVGGTAHFCVRNRSGHVSCWGSNGEGELGDGTDQRIEARGAPAGVRGLVDVIQISAASSFSGALDANGSVWLWGRNSGQVMGDKSLKDSSKPIKVIGLCPAVEFSAGSMHVCALCEDDTVWCWGWGRDCQLGDGKCVDYSPAPVRVAIP